MKNKAASQLGKLSWASRKKTQDSEYFKELSKKAAIARKKNKKAKK